MQNSGKWSGLIGLLKEEKVDMVMTSLKITQERSEQIFFSVPFQETGITILVSIRKGAISPTAFLGECNLGPRRSYSNAVYDAKAVHSCRAPAFTTSSSVRFVFFLFGVLLDNMIL